MIDWAAIVTIVTIITGAIVGLGTLWINSRVGQLSKVVKDQTATIASLHAIILGQHDPLLAIEGALTALRANKHAPEFNEPTMPEKKDRFPKVADEPYSAMQPFRKGDK